MLTTTPVKRSDQSDNSQNIPKPYSKTAAKELRRSRGEIACAECRRLKVRCNRQIPCSTCIARGCMALCPNGTLPPGDNSRHVSYATDHLQRKITKMEERMRALEDALAIAQATASPLPHPLLTTTSPLDEPEVRESEKDSDAEKIDSVLDSFGTLHIDGNERTERFFGPSGGSESLLINDPSDKRRLTPGVHEDIGPVDLRSLGIPEELDVFFHSFPLAPVGIPTDHILYTIESYLPPKNRAEAVCKCMLDSMSWMFHIVSLYHAREELIPYVYGIRKRDGFNNMSPYHGPHALALLLIILAIGSLVDLSLPPYNEAAQRYYVLALVALATKPMMETVSLSTLKTLHLISIYCGMSGTETNMPNQYAILNLASRLAQKIGLHVDPTHWNMGERDVYDRRCYFYNLLQADLMQSTYSGRPPALAESMYSCRIPSEADERKFQEGEYPLGFGIWGYHYIENCLAPVMKLVVAAKHLTYQAILDLDQKIRKVEPPPKVEYTDKTSVAQFMSWYPRSHYKELILLNLHRSFFARAIADSSSNPFESPYGYSFVTAYECACTVLRTTTEHFIKHPQLFSRVWMIWSFCFASAVVVGAVAARYKNLDIYPPPLLSLQSACDLFERASKTNSRAAKALPVLLDMKDRATHLHEDQSSPTSIAHAPGKIADEAAILWGRPRLVESLAGSPTLTPKAAPSTLRQEPDVHTAPLNINPVPLTRSTSYHPAENPTSQAHWDNIPLSNAPYNYPQSYQQQPWTQPTISAAEYPRPNDPTVSTVDFSLEETWTNFLQQYGGIS